VFEYKGLCIVPCSYVFIPRPIGDIYITTITSWQSQP